MFEIWLYTSFKLTGGKEVNVSAWYLKGTGFDTKSPTILRGPFAKFADRRQHPATIKK
jgi:hypothetical protein